MKAADINKAARLVSEHKKMSERLDEANRADRFECKMSYGGAAWNTVAGDDREEAIIKIEDTGSYGSLAGSLKLAAIAYYEFHVNLILKELEKLGVEP